MSDNKEKELKLEPEIKTRLDKISEDLTIPFSKVLNASIFHGINHFWFPLQQYYSELEVKDQPVKEEDYEPLLQDLKTQIEFSNTIIQGIDKYEEKFEKNHPYGKFKNFSERNNKFIKFIEESTRPKEIISIETPIIQKVVEKKVIQVEETPPEEPPIQAESFFKKCVAFLTPQIHGVWDVVELIIFVLLTSMANFGIFWGVSSYYTVFFNFGYFLRYNQIMILVIPVVVFLVILVTSLIIGLALYYVFHKIENRDK